jgi:zinc D-Ala-D-Ala carboxypeptidase
MYKYFKLDELKCKCGQCGSSGYEMDMDFMRKLDALRESVGFALTLSSAYRCPKHNISSSSTGADGPHTTGKAVDVAVAHEQAYAVMKSALELGFTGVGVNQKGASRFIHLDTLTKADNFPRPTLWSY